MTTLPEYTGDIPDKDTMTTTEFDVAAQDWVDYQVSLAAAVNDYTEEQMVNLAAAAEGWTTYAAGTTYDAGDIVADPGDGYLLYVSQAGSNTGNTPNTDDGTYWERLLVYQGLVLDARTSNTALGRNDMGEIIDITSGTFTQTFAATATLRNGWYIYIRNSGTGEITLDPSGSEEIDGLTSFKMYPGEMRLIQCDGTKLTSFVMKAFYTTFTSSGTFTTPPGYTMFKGLAWGAGASGARGHSYRGHSTGGGCCAPFELPSSDFGTTETITIGAGGAPLTTDDAGNTGGNTTIGSLLTSYGGDSNYGGGVLAGGQPRGTGFGDSGHPGSGGDNVDSAYGGSCKGQNAWYGGASGGGEALGPGTSTFGGNGGAYSASGTAGSGDAPGGAGGSTDTGTSGAGGDGEVRIWGVI